MAPHFPGAVIAERYRLESMIGEGGHGSVWRATQLGINRAVAIKFLTRASDPRAASRFEREAQVLASLSHPNCVTVHDFGRSGSDRYIVTEYIRGHTLETWRNRSRSVAEILEIATQTCSALAHAHRHRIVHRDLKPGNIIVDYDDEGRPQVKVLDFGIAKVLGTEYPDITKTGLVVGTPGYMSPEQLTGREITPATDLYAFGVLLYVLLEGRRPFHAESNLALALRHIKEDAPPLTRQVSPELRALVGRLLQRNPDDRYPSAQAALSALRNVATDAGLSVGAAPARPEAADPPTPRIDSILAEPNTEPTHPVAAPDTVPPVGRRRSERRWARTSLVYAALGLGCLALLVAVFLAGRKTASAPPQVSVARPAALLKHRAAPVVAEPTPDLGPPSRDRNRSDGCGRGARTGWQDLESIRGLEKHHTRAYVPSGYDPDIAHPVVIMFHDRAQRRGDFMEMTALHQRADADNVVLVVPFGNVLSDTWSSEGQYVGALDELQIAMDELCINPEQVAALGHGFGGDAADYMPCLYSGVRAVVTSSHRHRGDEPLCDIPRPLLFLAPLKDGIEPIEGGRDCLNTKTAPLESNEALFASRHGCGEEVEETRYGTNICYARNCVVPFTSCHLNAGRPWKGKGPRISCEGRGANDFDYRAVVWEFIAKHTWESDADRSQ